MGARFLTIGGDTGYGKVFRDIGELFAPIDLALERQGISGTAGFSKLIISLASP